ncbi:MAG: hypothetical protein ACREFQ_22445 [Stellaceae bacterium]
MLNKILTKMNGSAADPAVIEQALVQLAADKEAAKFAVDELQRRRHQALLDDAPDGELDKLERQLDRALARLEKLSISEQPLRERLALARTEKQRAAIARHRDAMPALYRKLRQALEAAASAQAEVTEARAAAVREVGEQAATVSLPYIGFAGVLTAASIEDWSRHVESVLAIVSPKSAPRAQPVAPPRPRAKPMTDTARQVRLAGGRQLDVAPPQQHQRRPDDTGELGPGEARCRVLRHGYPDANGQQCGSGQLIRLALETAKLAASHGAIEIIGETRE